MRARSHPGASPSGPHSARIARGAGTSVRSVAQAVGRSQYRRVMAVLGSALAARRAASESPAWVLLRSQHAASAVALLAEHLGGEVRRRPAPELFELIDRDLVDLRENGIEMPSSARVYCDAWRAEGVLIRRSAEGTREETYELSDGALVAIRFVMQLLEPRTSVTQSRLTTILERLHDLAMATDPGVASRLAALEAERARIDAEIARVQTGDYEVLPVDRAAEQVRDLLLLADELPADFARVRAEMERINRTLRARLVDDVASRGSVLDEVFRGVDHLAESEAGRSFQGFFTLILDSERVAAFEDDVDAVLGRAVATALTPSQVRTMRRLLPTLQDASGEIHDVMTAFSRSLRRFVQTDELTEHRQVQRLLQEAQREATGLVGHVQPFTRTGMTLPLTSVAINPVSALVLHNPAENRTAQDVVAVDADDVAWAQLVEDARASEIDLAELRGHVNTTIARRGAVSIAEVVAEHPATQGLASVVGLLVLADQHAVVMDGTEPVRWTTASGAIRAARVPRRLFMEEVP